jgi:hypothetical protein
MSTGTHRITQLAVAAIVATTAACGGHQELHAAQHSVYDIDFAVVYREAMGAVQKLYPNFAEDATSGKIQTSWHQVHYSNTTGDDVSARGTYAGAPMGGMGTSTVNPTGTPAMGSSANAQLLSKRYFVRFDVTVVGGRPWRVHVVGHASEWEPGNAVPTELHGGNTPHWLGGRTDELVLAIYERLKPYAKAVAEDEPARTKEEEAEHDHPIDTSAFGAIPPAAAKAAAALERAVELRDYAALRDATAPDVRWSLGADPGAEAALAMWQADPTALDALVAAMKAGCAAVADGKQIVCPAKSEAPGYLGWRVVLEQRGAAWKLTTFVKIE